MIFKTNLLFIFWMDPMVDLGGKNILKLLFIFWIIVWKDNENDFYFLDGPHGGKNILKLLFIFWMDPMEDLEVTFYFLDHSLERH